MKARDRIALALATLALQLATPRTRARIQLAVVHRLGGQPSPELLKSAELDRWPGA